MVKYTITLLHCVLPQVVKTSLVTCYKGILCCMRERNVAHMLIPRNGARIFIPILIQPNPPKQKINEVAEVGKIDAPEVSSFDSNLCLAVNNEKDVSIALHQPRMAHNSSTMFLSFYVGACFLLSLPSGKLCN